ncbi:BnaA02g25940D [Brassica napus]|uniref:BnaA02g25940D protein n=3 Tax=Brassica TaxID=3705 RepID=A0A078F7S3_BRANA|nr:BnaA02g25940D [Brassica napus]
MVNMSQSPCVYSLSRMKESFATKFKTFQIPVDWMLENGITSQIKLASVKLAMKYMKRVSAELEAIGGGGPEEEELIVQGVRFAFRVHQVKAKGLDHLLLFWFGFVTTFVCPNS